MSLKTRFALSFSLVFVLVSLVTGWLSYMLVHQQLQDTFQQQVAAQALNYLAKVSVRPRIIPVPTAQEHIMLLHLCCGQSTYDTLYVSRRDSHRAPYYYLSLEKEQEDGSLLVLNYGVSRQPLNSGLRSFVQRWLLINLFGLMAMLTLAFWLSRWLWQPLRQLIHAFEQNSLKANWVRLSMSNHSPEIQSLIESYNRMVGRLQNQSQTQEAFYTAIAHELRTPLSNMKLQLQAQPTEHASQAGVVCHLNEQVERMIYITNTFLLLAKIENQQIQAVMTQVELTDLIYEVIEELQGIFSSKEQSIQMHIHGEPFVFLCDRYLLQQLLNNLLVNAGRHAPARAVVRIELSYLEMHYISISIQNPSAYPAVRLPPIQLKQSFFSTSPDAQSVGLGLWISQQIANLLNWKMSIETDEHLFKVNLFKSIHS